MNDFNDGIIRKDEKLTQIEIEWNKKIFKVRYIVEQYFGLSHLHDNGQRARFTTIETILIFGSGRLHLTFLKNWKLRHRCVQMIKMGDRG